MVVEQRYTHEETLDGLMWLQSQGVIALMSGNRLKLIKPLSVAG